MEEEHTIIQEPQTETQEAEKPRSNWFRNIMSVDETRISALILCMVASLVFAGYIYLTRNEISAIWADIVETLIFCITGINISQVFTGNGKGKLGATLQQFLGDKK